MRSCCLLGAQQLTDALLAHAEHLRDLRDRPPGRAQIYGLLPPRRLVLVVDSLQKEASARPRTPLP